MNGAGCRRKGHDFERWVANELKAIFPNSRRGLQYQDGACPPDVIGTPFHIECKKGKRTDIKAAMLQAENDSAEHAGVDYDHRDGNHEALRAVAITKDDKGPALATMRFEDWMALVEAVYGRREADGAVGGSGSRARPLEG